MHKPLRVSTRRLNRSAAGSIAIFLVLGVFAAFMVLPLVYTMLNAFKPLDELYLFPPRLFVTNPTTANFTDLLTIMASTWVPFGRYIINTVIITGLGVAGHVILASAAAYPLAKHDFPFKKMLFSIVVLSLMFSAKVTAIPNYMIVTALGLNNTYWAVILPACASSLGLYLMKQFMEQLPDSLMESARLEGAGEVRIFWSIVMPNVKPAWLTLFILMFQQLWSDTGASFLRAEEIKPLAYALNQIAQGGTARAGAASAAGLLLMSVPILLFVVNQSRIIETMASSGMKE